MRRMIARVARAGGWQAQAKGVRAVLMLLLLLVTSATARAEADLIIRSDADWNTFASNVNNGTETYEGKTVMLATDITVSTMVGTGSSYSDIGNLFRGTFDGCGHTLNLNIQGGSSEGAAPFHYIGGATIKNVKTTGTVSGANHCSGLVGFAASNTTNTIQSCWVDADITCTTTHAGGILGWAYCATVRDCLFSGSITGSSSYTGIIYGWGDDLGAGTSHTIINCLAAGTYTNCGGTHMLVRYRGTESVTNCYKTQNVGSYGTYTTATGETLRALLGDGWELNNGDVVPKMVNSLGVSYRAYNAGTKAFETLTANNFTEVTSSTTTMGAANTETWYVVNSNVTVSSSRIEVLGTVNLILVDGKSMRAEKGLHVPSGVTLNIYGQSSDTGQLHSFSNTDQLAGIGGNNNQASGTITIHGGSIEAIGAFQSAGIGGGRAGNGGTTTIYGGTINATGGNYGAGIGGGVSGNGGTITIIGGTVIANAGTVDANDNSQAIGKGAGTGSGGTLVIDNMKVYSSANASNPVAPADRQSICQSKYAKLMPCTSHNFVNGVCTICGGTPDVDNPRAYLAYQTATQTFVQMEANNPTFVTGSTTTLGADNTETWYSVNNNVTVSSRIEVKGTVHLILCDGKTLTASQGITVNSGNTLNIYGQSGTGALNATAAGGNYAGIGTLADQGNALGTISIHGGHIRATGADWSAGIGGGVSSGGGTINIYGGNISAIATNPGNGAQQAIGSGSSGVNVDRNIADGLRVIYNNTIAEYGNRLGYLGQKTVTVEPCTEHHFSNKKCTYCGFEIYNVTYNGNNATSGTAPVDATDYEKGQTVTVLGNTGNLMRTGTGYTFGGWNTQADGLGTNYSLGATFTINSDITLYAQWTPITYTVRFHKNDGSGVFTDQTFTYNASQALATNAFTRDGLYFAGWSTTPDGTETYTDGQSIINLATEQDAVVNLYALWVQAIYTISYDLAGGTVATPNPTTCHEYSSNITLVNPTRKGYAFIGWTGTGLSTPTYTVIIPSGSTGNRSYTANWEEGVDYLAYNTTTQLFEAQFILLGDMNTVTSETTSMSNGWYIVENDVSISSRITVTGTVNLILLDGKTLTASNGVTVNSGNTLNIYAQVGGTGTLVASVSGSNRNAGIGSVYGSDCGTISIHGGIITATGGPYSAGIGAGLGQGGGTINIYGGTVNATAGPNGSPVAIGKGSHYYDVKDVTRFIADGLRVFVGDNTTPVGYDTRVSSLDNLSVRIEPCTEHNMDNYVCTYCGLSLYHVTYDGNNSTNGTVPTDATEYEKGQMVTVLGNTGNLMRTGYTFGGWNTQADGLGTDYAPGASFIIGTSLTLYAKWNTRQLTLANNAGNGDAINTAAGDGLYYDVTLADRTIYCDGDWNTLVLPFDLDDFTGTPLEGATVKTLASTDFNDGTLTMNFSDDLNSIEAGKPYIVKYAADLVIRSTADWNTFADNVNNGTESYAGKTVMLAADISVSTMVGTGSNYSDIGNLFRGIFDGCGHTLDLDIQGGSSQGAAPFHYIGGATIKNVKTTGTVSGANHCSGLVGFAASHTTNSIQNCWVDAAITCSSTHSSGILGWAYCATVRDCLFSGSITGSTKQTGIIYGWGDDLKDGITHTIINCLAAGTYTNCSNVNMLICHQGTAAVTNCYKTQSIGSNGTYTTATGNDLQAQLGDGWEVSGGNVVPKMVSNIVNPVFTGVTISDATANVETTYVDFMGTYSPVIYSDVNRSVLFLGGGSTLYYPDGTAPTTIGACRGYFTLNGLSLSPDPSPVGEGSIKAFVLNFGDERPTLVSLPSGREAAGAWYDLGGRKVSKPTQRGIYINNGKKVVIK